jgi:hypothetical protein
MPALPQVTTVPVCLACDAEREVLERLTRHYAIRSYRCPKCKMEFRIAERIGAIRKRRKSRDSAAA